MLLSAVTNWLNQLCDSWPNVENTEIWYNVRRKMNCLRFSQQTRWWEVSLWVENQCPELFATSALHESYCQRPSVILSFSNCCLSYKTTCSSSAAGESVVSHQRTGQLIWMCDGKQHDNTIKSWMILWKPSRIWQCNVIEPWLSDESQFWVE